MKFNDIYDHVLGKWGNIILINDGSIEMSSKHIDTPGTAPLDEIFYSENLHSLWSKIEDEIGYENPYYDLMVWTMYQVIHKNAIKLFKSDCFKIYPKNIPIEEIEQQFLSNLQEESWEKELRDYSKFND